MLIFLSSKIDTRDKDFRKKLFNILNEFTDSKKNFIELSEHYISLFEEIIKLLSQEKKSWVDKFIDILSKIKALSITTSIIIIFIFMYLMKNIDKDFYNDMKNSLIKPTTRKIERIIKE
jgi:predicted PurR-regulated permease PerM